MKKSIKVYAPASVSNLGCGFDILGFAIEEPGDEVVVKYDSSAKDETFISKIEGDKGKLPKEVEKNTAGAAILSYRKAHNVKGSIEIEIYKKMPFGSGLGSSAASACAAALAINLLMDNPLPKQDIIPQALDGEKIISGSIHADNVAPCLLGGLTFIKSVQPVEVIPIPYPDNLYCFVVHPHLNLPTKKGRKLLNRNIEMNTLVQQTCYLGGLILGFTQNNLDLIADSLKDAVVEPIRKLLIPFYSDIIEIMYAEGALGANISGSGPSIFALTTDEEKCVRIKQKVEQFFKAQSVELPLDFYYSKINKEGTKEIG